MLRPGRYPSQEGEAAQDWRHVQEFLGDGCPPDAARSGNMDSNVPGLRLSDDQNIGRSTRVVNSARAVLQANGSGAMVDGNLSSSNLTISKSQMLLQNGKAM